MLPDLVVWFDGGRAANENRPDELGTYIEGCLVVYVVEPADIIEEHPHSTPLRPPPPPVEAEDEPSGPGTPKPCRGCSCCAVEHDGHEGSYRCLGCQRFEESCDGSGRLG